MNKERLNQYLKWLATASDKQIEVAHQEITDQMPKFMIPDVRRESKLRLKLLEECWMRRFLPRVTLDELRIKNHDGC